jgi:hypothetical protein
MAYAAEQHLCQRRNTSGTYHDKTGTHLIGNRQDDISGHAETYEPPCARPCLSQLLHSVIHHRLGNQAILFRQFFIPLNSAVGGGVVTGFALLYSSYAG